ncbi:NRDE family protein [Oxalobacter vibrioformis]|uniref:NRDE family protein n=1 Tax=Oxalobacter vibrioformis TaxID=933080 RepID=A0A9E9LW10_9BURK|nr:NRDE family protein [Oxalobacter vibrioformis]WAW10251.1 NRDE family protein [Oxalobacter vibrioformis]
MCLIVFAWQVVPSVPLIAAANRDEFYARPAEPAHWWTDFPDIYAGRDLEGGGTWMGIRDGEKRKNNRFAAITNVRAPQFMKPRDTTRGKLVSDFLESDLSPDAYIASIRKHAHKYNGFNLLVGDAESMIWFSNCGYGRSTNGKPLAPGIYGLSNALLNDPWPKVVRTRAQFASLLGQRAPMEAYFEMLSDTTPAPEAHLPDTGIGREREKALSSVCIITPEYGTRASTLAQLYNDKPPVLDERVIR